MAASTRSSPPPVGLDAGFVRRVLFVLAVIGLTWLAFKMATVLLMIFGAVLIAVLLRALAELLNRALKLPRRAALAVSCLLFLALLGTGATLLVLEIRSQIDQLPETLPEAWTAAERRIEALPFGGELLDRLRAAATGAGLIDGAGQAAGDLAQRLKDFLGGVGAAATNAVLVIAGGIYLAISPATYRNGVLLLIPRARRESVGRALDETGQALRLWLLGILLDMIGVGLITGLGLWAVGLPSPALLGLLAGLGVLVPIIGPTLAALPGLLLAVAGGPDVILLTLAVYVVVQQVESNLIMPVVQRQIVALPPLVTLFSIAVFGLLFGPAGVLLAVPLAVSAYVLVRALYIRDLLGEPIRPLGRGRSSG